MVPPMSFRHFPRARVPLEPWRRRRAPQWAPIVGSKDGFTGPNRYLGSKSICVCGSGYPTLGCSRLKDPMRVLPSLSLCFLLLQILSFSILPFPKLASPSLPSFLIFIALVNGVIIIIFPLSAKKGPISINLSGFLGTNGFGNGSHCSECVRQWSFLRFCRALK